MEKLIGLPGKGQEAGTNTMKTLENLMKRNEVYLDLRTTIVPTLNDHETEIQGIGEILRSLGYETRGSQGSASYTLQEFVPEHARDENVRRIKSPTTKDLSRLATASNLEYIYIKHRDIGFMVHKNELSRLIPNMA
jgi:pyruvate-formate lyase-activating enzyme